MALDTIVEEVARVCRVLHRLGLSDLMGHVSARLADPALVAVQPGYGPGVPPPGRVDSSDIVVVDLDGTVVTGRWEPPRDLQIDLEVYRARTDVRSVIYAAPPTVLAMGIARRGILPLTHNEASFVVDGIGWHAPESLVTSPARGRELARALGDLTYCQVPGLGVVCVADGPLAALRRCEGLEYLAQLNVLTASLGNKPRSLTASEAATIVRQRDAGEKAPSRDLGSYYAAFDNPRALGQPTWFESLPAPRDEQQRIKQRLALACRMLARQGTLVAFYEHISHRLPNDDSRFLMTPSKNFPDIEPDDVGVVGTSGQCEWLDGPYPPAPFRHYHRDVLMARSGVNAIVHTHEMFGRAFAMSGRPLRPVFRNGAALAVEPGAHYPRPSMVLTPEDRRAALEALGQGPMLHILSHGTDHLAASLEEATVMAIHREQLYRLNHQASQLGEPTVLGASILADLKRLGPTADDWWAYYAADV